MTTHHPGAGHTAAALQTWLLGRLAELLERPAAELDPDLGFTDLGVSSRLAVTLSGELEDHLDRDLSPTLLWEQRSVAQLARFLAGGGAPEAGTGPVTAQVPVHENEPIAVVGVGLRLPGGVDSPEAYWRLLRDGVDAVTEVPANRWDADALYDPAAGTPGRSVSKWGSFLDRIDEFDAPFFEVSAREADAMDPQQRLLLEVAWEAFERAGIPAADLRGSRTGVVVGISNDDYGRWQAADPASAGPYTNTGSAMSIAANRLSYFFDLQGPSLSVDTACSSSLVAVHLAVRSLRSGESDTVLAGASNLVLSPVVGVNFSASGAVSPTGRCQTFDARADGMVRGEGVGAVVLRRLGDALRDGQPVLAVIRGSAVNQDGRSNGLMAPAAAAQTAVVRQAWQDAGVDGAEIGLLEAHGTGTPLGDPIEIGALKEAFGPGAAPRSTALGAVKSQLGHLEAAAGLAGLIKAVLCVRHGEIPGNLHFEELNPRIDLDGSPFFVPTATAPWPLPGASRIAGVSSFGFGGTNAHVVVEQAPPRPEPDASPGGPDVVLLSARDDRALRTLATRTAELLDSGVPAADIAFTAARHRSHLERRTGVVGDGAEELAERLAAVGRGELAAGTASGRASGVAPSLVWCFSGQGGQWDGMGRELLATSPAFAAEIDRLEPLILAEGGFSVREALLTPGALNEAPFHVLQPLIFAVQLGLAAWWRSMGVTPDAVIGSSMGEVAAAAVAGILTPADAVRVICHRARLLEPLAGQGAMAVVDLPAAEVRRRIAQSDSAELVSVAVRSAPEQTVVSGAPDAVRELTGAWEAAGVRCRAVGSTVPGHSPQTEPAARELERTLTGLTPAAPAVPMYSTVDPGFIAPTGDAAYWARNVRDEVRFCDVVEALLAEGHGVFLEIGPHPVAAQSIDRTSARRGGEQPLVLASTRREQPERAALLASAAQLHCHGVGVDWSGRYPRGRRTDLPAYPWQRAPHWFTTRAPHPTSFTGAGEAQLVRPAGYALTWQPAAPAEPPVEDGPIGSREGWLVLGDRGPAATAVVVELARRGRLSHLVEQGAGVGERVLEAVRDSGRSWHVLDLRALAPAESGSDDLPARARARVHALAGLVRELASLPAEVTARLWAVTRQAQPVLDGEGPLALDAAPLWGLGRTARLEHPERWGGLIDVDLGDPREFAGRLVDEVESAGAEDQVALRGTARHVARLVPAAPTPHGGRAEGLTGLDTSGAHLVVGASGTIGLELARWLVDRGVRHLVLTSRRGLDTAYEPELAALRARGATVTAVAADAADPVAMGALFQRFERAGHFDRVEPGRSSGGDLPPLRGVYHLATSRTAGPLTGSSAAEADAALAAKIDGGWLLHHLAEGHDIRHLVFFSSLTALLGSVNLGYYAAANGFLDALAHERHRKGLPALSIGWGLWENTLGAAAEQDHVQRSGQRELTASDGLAAFGRLLASPAPHPVFAVVDWDVLGAAYQARRPFPLIGRLAEVSQAPAPVRVKAPAPSKTTPVQKKAVEAGTSVDELRTLVRDQLAAVLRIADKEDVDTGRGFFDLGLDSMTSVELRRRLEGALSRTLPPTVAFDYPNVDELAEYLAGAAGAAGPVDAAPAAPAPDAAPAPAAATDDPDELADRLAALLEEL